MVVIVVVMKRKDLKSGKVVLQHYNIAFSDKKSDHIICQGYLNLLLWKGKLLLCHLIAPIYSYSGVCAGMQAWACVCT